MHISTGTGKPSALRGPSWSPSNSTPCPREIRISDAKVIFRVMYVAKFEEAVYVLHCFQKQTQATSKQDKDIDTFRTSAEAVTASTSREPAARH